jgi:leucine-zipper-like transcriptional regulator 1
MNLRNLARFNAHSHRTATNTWNKEVTAGITPKSRHFHTAVVYKDHMYILGGFAGSRNTADLLRYNFGSRTWTVQLGSEALTQRRGHSAVVWRDNLMIFGGKDSLSMNDLSEFSFTTGKSKVIDSDGEVPPPRHFHTCVMHDGRLWIFGGLAAINLNDVYAFQLGSWVYSPH